LARLLIVRHGETEYNSTQKFAGITDVDLSATGRRQIEKLRDRLADEKIDAVCSSNLQRAITSAEILVTGRNLPIDICPELSEMNYGGAEGLTFDEINQNYPHIADALINRSCEINFPNGECFNDLQGRVRQFIAGLTRYKPEETLLIVAHSGPLTMLVCLLLQTGNECWWRIHLDNASLSIINTYPETAILNLFNDTSHLQERNLK